MMSTRDLGHVADLFRPRYLLQEVECMHHVRLDLHPLAIVERALADGEQPHLIAGEQRLRAAVEIHVVARSDLQQFFEIAFRQHGWLIRLQHGCEMIVQGLQLLGEFAVEFGLLLQEFFAPFLQCILQLRIEDLSLQRALHEVEALLDQLQL